MGFSLEALVSRLKRRALRNRRLLKWATMRRRATLGHVTFITVTGSCGKTTTTALSTAILSSAGHCQSGMAWEFGKLAKTIRAIGPSTTFCFFELGATGPGSLAEPLQVIKPQIGMVTNIGGDHYRSFRGIEAAALEKGRLVECLPQDGIAILNADDPNVRAMAQRTRARIVSYGRGEGTDLRATKVSSPWPDRLSLTVTYGQKSVRVETQLVGEHWMTSVLAAIACGLACGVDLKTCANVVKTIEPVFGRYSVHNRSDGGTYVLDTRKAPFWTIAHGLAFVACARAARKTIVIGTISDYPGAGGARYRRVARQALEVAERVIFVGPNSASVEKVRMGKTRDKLFTFQTTYQASAFLSREGHLPGELIYVKASGADHLERLMLAELDQVVCWRERCGRTSECLVCPQYHIPKPPPLGLGRPGVPAITREDVELDSLS